MILVKGNAMAVVVVVVVIIVVILVARSSGGLHGGSHRGAPAS